MIDSAFLLLIISVVTSLKIVNNLLFFPDKNHQNLQKYLLHHLNTQ